VPVAAPFTNGLATPSVAKFMPPSGLLLLAFPPTKPPKEVLLIRVFSTRW